MAYYNGNGIDKNEAKAATWFFKSMQGKNAEAEKMFYSFYSKDLEKFAKKGDNKAQYEVGMAYYNGNGIDKNEAKAATWFLKAMQGGNDEAKKMFYSYYNPELAKLANNGDAEAQYQLGLCYYNGSGIVQDPEIAGTWFYKAKNNGNVEARKMLYSYKNKAWTERLETHKMRFRWPSELIAEVDKSYFGPYSDEYDMAIKDNTYFEIYNEFDTIKGILQGEKIIDAKFIHRNLWEFEGEIKTNLAECVRNNTGDAITFVLLKGGKLTICKNRKNNQIWDGNCPYAVIQNTSDLTVIDIYSNNNTEFTYGSRKKTPKRTEEYRYGHVYSFKDFSINKTDKFLVPKNWWSNVFPYDTYTSMKGEHGDYAFGYINYTASPGERASVMGYQWQLPNNAIIIDGMQGYDSFTYFSSYGDHKKMSHVSGEIMTSTNHKITWNTDPSAADGKPYVMSIVTAQGDSIYISSAEPLAIHTTTDLYNMANGKKTYLSEDEASAIHGYYSYSDFVIFNWKGKRSGKTEGVNGTYTFADGRVEKIIDGQTESDIKAEQEYQAKLAAKAKQEYDEKCAKYGKAFVDAAAKGEIKKGMHWDLVTEYYDARNSGYWTEHYVSYSDGTSVYHIIGAYSKTVRASIYLKDMKVTDFIYY